MFTLCDNLEVLGVKESDNSAILTSESKLMLDEGRDIPEGDDWLGSFQYVGLDQGSKLLLRGDEVKRDAPLCIEKLY